MIKKYLQKNGLKLTPKGQNFIDNIQGVAIALLILVAFAIVGTIEAAGR